MATWVTANFPDNPASVINLDQCPWLVISRPSVTTWVVTSPNGAVSEPFTVEADAIAFMRSLVGLA